MRKLLVLGLLLSGLLSCGNLSADLPAKAPEKSTSQLSVIYSDTVTSTSEDPNSHQNSTKIRPQQNLITLTYVQNRVEWKGPETLATVLTNGANGPSVISQQVSASSSGTISGGLEAQGIKLAIGYTGTFTKTTTVSVTIPGRGSAQVYSLPVGYKYFGYQRLAPVGVDWAWCNKNPANCPALTSWSAINVTGIGFRTQ